MIENVKIKSNVKTNAETVSCTVGKSLVGTVSCFTMAIGVWGTVCLFSGIINAGGIFSLTSNYLSAIM